MNPQQKFEVFIEECTEAAKSGWIHTGFRDAFVDYKQWYDAESGEKVHFIDGGNAPVDFSVEYYPGSDARQVWKREVRMFRDGQELYGTLNALRNLDRTNPSYVIIFDEAAQSESDVGDRHVFMIVPEESLQ